MSGESSYSHFPDTHLGLAVVDRFSFYLFEFLQRVEPNSTLTVLDMLDDLRCSTPLAYDASSSSSSDTQADHLLAADDRSFMDCCPVCMRDFIKKETRAGLSATNCAWTASSARTSAAAPTVMVVPASLL